MGWCILKRGGAPGVDVEELRWAFYIPHHSHDNCPYFSNYGAFAHDVHPAGMECLSSFDHGITSTHHSRLSSSTAAMDEVSHPHPKSG